MLDAAFLLEGNDFGASDDHNAEFVFKIFAERFAGFFVFAREKARGTFHDENFGAEFGVIFGDFATSGTATDDESEFWQTTNFHRGVWSEIVDSRKATDFAGFELGAGSKNELFRSVLLLANSDGVFA